MADEWRVFFEGIGWRPKFDEQRRQRILSAASRRTRPNWSFKDSIYEEWWWFRQMGLPVLDEDPQAEVWMVAFAQEATLKTNKSPVRPHAIAIVDPDGEEVCRATGLYVTNRRIFTVPTRVGYPTHRPKENRAVRRGELPEANVRRVEGSASAFATTIADVASTSVSEDVMSWTLQSGFTLRMQLRLRGLGPLPAALATLAVVAAEDPIDAAALSTMDSKHRQRRDSDLDTFQKVFALFSRQVELAGRPS